MKAKSIRISMGFLSILFMFLSGCASTIDTRGQKFTFQKGITIGQTTKREIVEAYGQPTQADIKGKFEVLTYYYGKESLKHGKSVGMGLLSAVPVVGFATLAMDHGVTESDIAKESQVMQVYVELTTGVVRDYYYHDSNLTGHDESETLYLKSLKLFEKGKNDEGIKMLEESVSLNPNNHRALNSLAWKLIDLNIDMARGIACAERAVSIFPDSPYNNGTLGCGYFKRGELENAEKHLKAAIELFPIYAPQDSTAFAHDKAMLAAVQERRKQE